jgi:ribosomal protein S20
VWSNLDRAHAYVADEAGAIQEAILLADALPPGERSAVRGAMREYLHSVQAEDWPAMAEARARVQPMPPSLTQALEALLSFVPTKPGQQMAQQRAVIAVEQILDARRRRIILSNTAIASIQWLVIAVLVALVMLIVVMVHVDRMVTVGVNLFVIATAIAACLVLLMVHDRPFAAGGSTVQPDAFHEIGVD